LREPAGQGQVRDLGWSQHPRALNKNSGHASDRSRKSKRFSFSTLSSQPILGADGLAFRHHRVSFLPGFCLFLKFDKNRQVDAIFDSLQIGSPQSDCATIVWGRNAAVVADQRAWRTECVAKRRRYASRPGPIRHVRGAMIELPTKGDVLARHPIESA